ncbi:MAG: efflux RND transporter periplasmic adaptor subunit [Imperialibacter sp.]|uniref:efflux RND transporter periplasmic adaptor subunit n=1 Tax=Imperialibacter sp. TaxID=2038411 RepID=UPI0032EC5D40
MKTNEFFSYLSFLIIGAIVVACTSGAANDSNQGNAPISRLPVDVKVVKSTAVTQEEVVAGSVVASREVMIASEVSRKVVAVSFTEGSVVHKGQLLYKLEDGEIVAKLKQNQAELGLAKLSEGRLAELLKNEAVRQEEYDVAQSRLALLQATEDLMKNELDKTSIHAPFSGKIGISKVEVGSWVSPGMPLVALQEQGSVKIQFSVPEKYIAFVASGKTIHFQAPTGGSSIAARIIATESGIDAASRSITVQAVADNRDNRLVPGMSAKVYFSVADENTKGLTLPTQALIPGANGFGVFVVKQGVARFSPVTVFSRNESDALITAGLADGDSVLVSNILRTGDGTPVQVVTAK